MPGGSPDTWGRPVETTGERAGEQRDSGRIHNPPPICTGAIKNPITGSPDPDHISTSFIERQNLTMRMGMRRFTRLTNGFSKKLENLGHAIALHFMYVNFVRRHTTLKMSPAMAAGASDHLWSLEEIVELIDREENQRQAHRNDLTKRFAE